MGGLLMWQPSSSSRSATKSAAARTQLFEANQYTDYLYLHGLGVESAEALAEFFHKRIRQEWGIGDQDAKEIPKLFKLHYRGCRYVSATPPARIWKTRSSSANFYSPNAST